MAESSSIRECYTESLKDGDVNVVGDFFPTGGFWPVCDRSRSRARDSPRQVPLHPPAIQR